MPKAFMALPILLTTVLVGACDSRGGSALLGAASVVRRLVPVATNII